MADACIVDTHGLAGGGRPERVALQVHAGIKGFENRIGDGRIGLGDRVDDIGIQAETRQGVNGQPHDHGPGQKLFHGRVHHGQEKRVNRKAFNLPLATGGGEA